jgi:hypothetical protein
MKRMMLLAAAAIALLAALPTAAYSALEIDWYSLDGGGGAVATGSLALHGTTGQADAHTSSAGPNTLTGGFWALPAMIPGDVDGSGNVDVVDLLYFVDAFGAVLGDANYDSRCDFNGDDGVDVIDLLYFVDNFGKY